MTMTQEQAKGYAQRSLVSAEAIATGKERPEYSPWRHGGYYVNNLLYPNGAVGCVSRNYPDGKWRIACDDRANSPTFRSRDEAARAEAALILADAFPQRITVGVLVEAGTVTEIRASHPEITVEVVDADVQDDEAQAEYANQRKAFDDLPHVVDFAL